jgi:uncharacterized membrane protein
MILQYGADAPWLLRAAAGSALVLHIGGASVGMVSGAVGVLSRKGGRLHRAAGNVFFVSMLIMSAVAAVVAPMLPDRISAMMGAFAFYLVATGWAAVRRKPGEQGRFELIALIYLLAVIAGFAWLAIIGASSPRGMVDGAEPYQIAVAFGAIATLAAAMDVKALRQGGVQGTSRVARHLWRMCLALFIAWGSGAAQPRIVPDALQGSMVTMLPAFGVLGLMAFWLLRPVFRKGFRWAAA